MLTVVDITTFTVERLPFYGDWVMYGDRSVSLVICQSGGQFTDCGISGLYDVTLSGTSAAGARCDFEMGMALEERTPDPQGRNLFATTSGSDQRCDSSWMLSPEGGAMVGTIEGDRISLAWEPTSGVTTYEGTRSEDGFQLTAHGATEAGWTWVMTATRTGDLPRLDMTPQRSTSLGTPRRPAQVMIADLPAQ